MQRQENTMFSFYDIFGFTVFSADGCAVESGNVCVGWATLIDGSEKHPANVCTLTSLQHRENSTGTEVQFMAASTLDIKALSKHRSLLSSSSARLPFAASSGAGRSSKTFQMSTQESNAPHEPQTATDQPTQNNCSAVSRKSSVESGCITSITLYVRLLQHDAWCPANRAVRRRSRAAICACKDRLNYQ